MKKYDLQTRILIWICIAFGTWFAIRLFLAILPLFLGSLAVLGTIGFLIWWGFIRKK
jgi:hypothetical protein